MESRIKIDISHYVLKKIAKIGCSKVVLVELLSLKRIFTLFGDFLRSGIKFDSSHNAKLLQFTQTGIDSCR